METMQKTHSLLVAVSTVLFFATAGQHAQSAVPAFTDANWVSMGARNGANGWVTAADGVFIFADTTAMNGAGFYRSRER